MQLGATKLADAIFAQTSSEKDDAKSTDTAKDQEKTSADEATKESSAKDDTKDTKEDEKKEEKSEEKTEEKKVEKTEEAKISTDTTKADEDDDDLIETGEPKPSFDLFSETSWKTEVRGLTHWLLFSDGESIYSFNTVRDSEPTELISGLRDVTQLAVDQNKGYLFIG